MKKSGLLYIKIFFAPEKGNEDLARPRKTDREAIRNTKMAGPYPHLTQWIN